MKRVIAVSDSHGDAEGLRDAFALARRAGSIDVAVFLGDGATEFAQVRQELEAQGAVCYVVAGNNDWGSHEAQEVVFQVFGVRFYACHGHSRYVKLGLNRLWYAAREREAQIALYGHTHRARVKLEHGMYIVNPGAVCERRKDSVAYAEICVEENGGTKVSLCKWG